MVDLLANGSFELHDPLGSASWKAFSALPGWTVETGKVEIQRYTVGGIRAVAGNDKLELDAYGNSSIYSDVTTEIGQRYRLSFYYSPRSTTAGTDTNDINVWWGDELLVKLSGDQRNWQHYSFALTADTANSRLRFEAVGKSDSIGGLLDGISLHTDNNLVVNGSFETYGPLSNSNWGVFSEIPGWTAQRGEFEIQTRSSGDIAPFHGGANLELDAFANSEITALVNTESDNAYQIGFVYSPRVTKSGTDSNDVEVWWDGHKLATLNGDTRGWTPYQFLVPGRDGGSVLEFRGAGLEDSRGGLIDDVYVNAQPDNCVVVPPVFNTWPTAIISGELSVNVGDEVTLDATASSDAEDDLLSYQWSFITQPQGSNVQLADSTTESITFVVNEVGSYSLKFWSSKIAQSSI